MNCPWVSTRTTLRYQGQKSAVRMEGVQPDPQDGLRKTSIPIRAYSSHERTLMGAEQAPIFLLKTNSTGSDPIELKINKNIYKNYTIVRKVYMFFVNKNPPKCSGDAGCGRFPTLAIGPWDAGEHLCRKASKSKHCRNSNGLGLQRDQVIFIWLEGLKIIYRRRSSESEELRKETAPS